jgi:short-subunit dehydrogenase
MEIKNSSVAITGANRGIGKAFAEVCAQDNAIIHLLIRKEDPELNSHLKNLGAKEVFTHVLDLENRESIATVGSRLRDLTIDVLFNNAGQLTGGLLEQQKVSDIYSVMQVNVTGLIHLTKEILPGMVARKKGKIINNSSVSSIMHFPCATTYAATKAAVNAFTNSLRSELAGTGVSTLLLITPGVETRMFNEIPKKYGKNLDMSLVSKSITTQKYAKMIREAVLEDLPVLKPVGMEAVGLMMATMLPNVFNKFVASKFKRDN